MRIFEAIQKTVVIYPGRFHPFHKGHASVYNYLKNKYDTVYIATSNKIDPPKSPFSFAEKRAMMVHAGIPAGAIVQSTQPYRAEEILRNFDPSTTAVAFAVSEKDMEEDPRFSFRPKKDGSPSYFQPMPKDEGTMAGFDTHGYITTVPTLDFTVLGEPMRSATELRRNFAKADDETQKRMITDLYGAYDEEIHNIMRNKIKEHADPYMEHVLAAESVLQDLTVLYEHRSFDMSHVAENAQKIIDKINSIPVVETLDYLDPDDAMDSIVAVPGVGTMSIRGLMGNILDKMKELTAMANKGTPTAFRDIKYRMDSNIIGVMMDALVNAFDDIENIRRKGGAKSKSIPKDVFDSVMHMHEAWSTKYKRSINCNNPKGFSQRAHCAGRKKKTNEAVITEYVFQSIPLRVLDNLASRKDNKPFPIKTGDTPDEVFNVTPDIARKFMNVYYQKEPEVQKAIDKTLNNPRKFIELFTNIMSGKKVSGAKVADIAPDKLTADVNEFKIEKPDAADTMGVPRNKMPQVATSDYPEFVDYLKDAGANFVKQTVPAKSLKAIQGEFSEKGVEKQLNKYIKGEPKKPVIASSDDYIIDGHHRWLVAWNTGSDVDIYRVNIPGKELLQLVKDFPKTTYKDIYETAGVGIIDKQNTTADVKPGETERQSKKLGLGGKPKLLHKTAAKNSDPNTLYNLGIAEIYTPLAIAIMEGGHSLPELDEDMAGFLDNLIAKKKTTGTKTALDQINAQIAKQREEQESELKAKLYKLTRQAMRLPRGSEAQRRVIDAMNPVRKALKLDPIAIPEGAEITMWTNPEYQGSDVDDKYYNKQPAKLIDINKLTPFEPADKMDDEISAANMNRLVKAIQAGQKINPIVVVPHKGKLLIIDGHHRYFATIKAGVDKIRAVMADPKDLTWRDDVPIDEAVSQVDIDQLERFADKMFAKVGIDVEFSKHFMDRVNDARNKKPITPAELTRLFKQTYQRHGKPIAQMGPEQQAVMKDMRTDINIPFMLQWDEENNELDLIAKTVMRKQDFKTSNREFAVERGGIVVPFASGNFASVVPHRALKIKKPTPGRLSYEQPKDNRKRNY